MVHKYACRQRPLFGMSAPVRGANAQAAWGSNHTGPRSCPAVKRTSASRAAARRRSRAMVGSVPPFFDALDLVGCHVRTPAQVGDAEA